jgi:hypothetical protein
MWWPNELLWRCFSSVGRTPDGKPQRAGAAAAGRAVQPRLFAGRGAAGSSHLRGAGRLAAGRRPLKARGRK